MGSNTKAILTVVAGVVIAAWFFDNTDATDDVEVESTAVAVETADPAPDAAGTTESQPEPEPPSPPPPPPSPWSVIESTSQMDDSRSIFLSTHSNESIPGRFSRRAERATLFVRCLENTTSLIFQMDNQHLSSSPYHDWGHVQMRIDDGQAFTKSMSASTNNRALGLWSGGQSIPVIRRMFDAERLTVRLTPYGENPITMTFNIRDLQEEAAPLREACHW